MRETTTMGRREPCLYHDHVVGRVDGAVQHRTRVLAGCNKVPCRGPCWLSVPDDVSIPKGKRGELGSVGGACEDRALAGENEEAVERGRGGHTLPDLFEENPRKSLLFRSIVAPVRLLHLAPQRRDAVGAAELADLVLDTGRLRVVLREHLRGWPSWTFSF